MKPKVQATSLHVHTKRDLALFYHQALNAEREDDSFKLLSLCHCFSRSYCKSIKTNPFCCLLCYITTGYHVLQVSTKVIHHDPKSQETLQATGKRESLCLCEKMPE